MAREKIEYKGEMLTIHAIAKKEKVVEETLRKYYKKTGNIYESAIKAQENRKPQEKIEYNGKMLTITQIAREEGVDRKALKRIYNEKSNIVEAVKLAKDNKRKSIEMAKNRITVWYKGEKLSIYAIAKKEKVSEEALKKYYEKTENITEALEELREIQERKKEGISSRGDIEYKGRRLSILAIAKIEDVGNVTLKKYYKKTGDIYEAINICKKEQEKRLKIDYNGKLLSLTAIAEKEGLSTNPLRKKYNETGNIYKAVEICKDNQKKFSERIKYIEYDGEKVTIEAIARKKGLKSTTLRRAYEEQGNIYKAIEVCKENQMKRYIEYNGHRLSISAIAKQEGLENTSLKNQYKETGNIYKAVLICKSRQRKFRKDKQKIQTKYGKISLYDLSLILGIKYNELNNLINAGHTIAEITEMNLKNTRREEVFKQKKIVLPNGQSLREYCIENSLNYSCICRAINTYGKSFEEAVRNHKEKGQEIPKTWIFKKYGVLLKHLMLRDKMDVDRVVKYMRKDILSMEEAVEKYVVRRNAKKENLDEDWLEEIYGVLTDENITNEYEEYKKTFYIDEKEEDCVIQSYDEIEDFKRKLLLFEISETIEEKVFTPEEEKEILRVYKVTPKEIEIMFSEFNSEYKFPGVLKTENEKEDQTEEQKKAIEQKIQKYKEILAKESTKQDEAIIKMMKTSVRENVGTNEEVRQELREELNKESSKTDKQK